MNAPVLASQWPKAKFTVAHIWALIERGIANPSAKFELIDGEVREVSPKGPLHEDVSRAVLRWVRSLPTRVDVLPETTLYLDEHNFVEPDYVVFDAGLNIRDLTPEKVLLAIEIGHESWSYDSGEKALRFARHGVQEYWAIHAPSKMIRVHRAPSAQGWSDVRDVAVGGDVAAAALPENPFQLTA